MSEDDAWEALSACLQDFTPPCEGRVLFTTDGLSDDQRASCASICAACPIYDVCGAYALAARVESGFWAGHSYTDKGKQPAGPRPRGGRPKRVATPSTTEAGAVPRQPTREGTPS